MTVPAKITILTLGVADLERACAFYDRLGWRRSSESNEWIVWFVTTGTVLGLTSYEALAEDAGVPAEPRGTFSGVTLAINVERGELVQPMLDEAEAAGGTDLEAGEAGRLGRRYRLLRGSRRLPVGGRVESSLPHG